MTQDSPLRNHLAGILLALSFIIALAFYLLLPPHWIARNLYFPGATGTSLSAERRLVPRSNAREHELSLVIEGVLLGPANIVHSRVFPRDTKVNSLILDGKVVYVDLNEAAMIENSEVHVDVATAVDAVRRTLLENFRYLDNVVVTIDGNIPFAPSYRPIGR